MGDRIGFLQNQGDELTRAMDVETARVAMLDRELAKYQSEMANLRGKRKSFKIYNHVGGGVDAEKQCHSNVQKEIKLMENRLNKALSRHSEIMNRNRKLKEEINYKRQKRLIFDDIYRKLSAKLKEKQEQMKEVMRKSNEANEARERAVEEENELTLLAQEESEQFEQEYNELAHYIEAQHRARDHGKISGKVGFSDKHKRGSLSPEEEASMQMKLDALGSELDTAAQKGGETQERIRSYEEAFDKLQQATGINDINELVTNFINQEDETFSLFSYIQSMNQEADELEEKIAKDKEAMLKFKESEGQLQLEKKQGVDNLKEKVDRLQKRCDAYQKQFEESKTDIELISKTVQSIFFKISCDQMSGIRDSAKGGSGKPNAKGGASDGVSSDMMLSGQDITDSNIMQYLGIIEQRAVEVCQEYSRQCKGLDLASSTGPQTPMQTMPKMQISVPQFDDMSEDGENAEAGGEDDLKPLNREELSSMAAVDVQKNKNRGATKKKTT